VHAAESHGGGQNAIGSRCRHPGRRHGAHTTRATWFTGTIFAVYEKTSPGIGTTADILRTGNDIVAAGYCMYGAATELVICFKGSGVERFALDPSLGEFIHTHTNVSAAPSALLRHAPAYGTACLHRRTALLRHTLYQPPPLSSSATPSATRSATSSASLAPPPPRARRHVWRAGAVPRGRW